MAVNKRSPAGRAIGTSRKTSEVDEAKVLATYKSMFAKHGAAPPSLGLRQGSQAVRFRAVISNLRDHPPDSLIDLGCGFGDLLTALRDSGWTGRYVGLDHMTEFVEVAREGHKRDSDASFVNASVLDSEFPVKSFDACVTIGLCNHEREAGSMAFIEALMARCVSLARHTALIDFLSETSDRRREDLFFTDPAEAVTMALRHSRRIALDHSYMPFEFMLRIRLDDDVVPDEPYFAEPV